jgi:hypothetical protein
MNNPYFDQVAKEDFNKARSKELFLKLFNFFKPENYKLLSFHEIRKIIKPGNIRYQGIKPVEIKLIVGSEGRYRDFNKTFFPRYDFLRNRWEGIDKAHLKDIILPPIKLYEIGGLYFVSDGNHRVSVAKLKGLEYVDAEITSLKTEIKLDPGMTKEDIKNKLIEYEKKVFFKNEDIKEVISKDKLVFTAIGRYNEIMMHIDVHKYFINMDNEKEMTYKQAVNSWYKNLFLPIYNIVKKEKMLSRFPGRTHADLYVWIIRHWDELKKKYGDDLSIKKAVYDYSEKFGVSILHIIKNKLKRIFRIK